MSGWRAHGMRAWLMQRLTAVYVALFFVSMLLLFVLHPFADYASWRQFMSMPVVNIATVFFFLGLIYHAWVGLRDVVIDYISQFTLRMITLMVVTLSLIALGIWAFMVLVTVVAL